MMRARLAVFAWRLLRRDLASGRLLVMLLAAVIAVASTVSINLLVSRVDRAMAAESSALLAADLAVTMRAPALPGYLDLARETGLRTAHTVTMRSVIAVGDELQLVRLKAVGAAYPLRGELGVAARVLGAATPVAHGPPRGEVWGDARLFQVLGLEPGVEVGVGQARFPLRRVLAFEPDRGGDVFSLAPRLMMHLDDLPDTGLIVPGSRASYRLLLSGPPQARAAFRARFEPARGDTLVDPREARPEMRSAFVQAERFLALAAFAGVLLASVGIVLAAGAYREHHEMTVAILKTLGLTGGEIRSVLGLEIVLLATAAALAGNGFAWLTHTVLLEHFMPGAEPHTGGLPVGPLVHGAWVSLVVLAGFALPALIDLTALPVMAILNRDRGGLPPGSPRKLLAMVLAIALIAPWHIGNAELIALAFGGMVGAAAVLALAAWLLVRGLGRLRARTAMSWRFGLASITRRARLSVMQSTAVGLGIAVILLLGLVRNDLLGQWRERLPDRAPNQFLINIQADEVEPIRAFLAAAGHAGVRFYPMVRGRLTAIDEAVVDPDAYADPRSRRLADREFNLSWARELKPDNRLLAGRWWSAAARGELSVEQGIAERLGIGLGDVLTFAVADRTIEGRVTSLRGVEWDNFEVNFFVVTTPDLLADAPATWITSFYLPGERAALLAELVRRFPSVTVIDVDALMRQVRQVMDRVSAALGWVFGFALAAGVLVLVAAVQASQRERVLDVVLLKTLGASRRFIGLTTLVEFLVLGALAGTLGACGALGTGWLLAHAVFDMSYAPHWRIPLVGIGAGVLGVALIGVVVVYQTHRQSVMASLRAAG